MKKVFCLFAVAALFVPLIGWTQDQKASVPDPKDKKSYALGATIGQSLKQQGLELNVEMLTKGLRDTLIGGEMLLNPKEISETMTALQNEMMAKAQEKAKVAGSKNKIEGDEFLANNKTKPGVVTTASGLQYKVISEGKDARRPKADETVTVNYRGTLIDGTEFDSSYKRGTPATFQVSGVIRGWVEALQLMSIGSKWQLFIPSNLAYGEKGAGPQIGPNATLIFEVELLSIK
jgi:FKBP-type peptidyl-prolyl cis-trans isomerase FklB